MKDVLFITATHGDEPNGVEVIRDLERERQFTTRTATASSEFDWVIGNKRAYAQNTRYCGKDLNRSAPGNPTSMVYEEQRAAELISLSASYRYTIDIHGTIKNTGIFLIVTNPSRKNLKLASLFDISHIVIWPSIMPEQQGPMSEYFTCGLEIECGEKNDPKIKDQLKNIITKFLRDITKEKDLQKQNCKGDSEWQHRLQQKQIYQMYGSLKRSQLQIQSSSNKKSGWGTFSDTLKMQEFKQTTQQNETFIPLFIGSYDYDDILCYKLKKITPAQALSLK